MLIKSKVMNKLTSQPQHMKTTIMNRGQPTLEAQQQTTVTSKPNNDSSGKEYNSFDTPDSLWSNLIYGLGMLAVIVIPPLIPGASVRLLIMGYMILIVSIYTLAVIVAAMRILRPTQASKRRQY